MRVFRTGGTLILLRVGILRRLRRRRRRHDDEPVRIRIAIRTLRIAFKRGLLMSLRLRLLRRGLLLLLGPLEGRGRVEGDGDGGASRFGARRKGKLCRGVNFLPSAVHEVVRRTHRVVVQVRALVLHVQIQHARVRVQRGSANKVRAQRRRGGRFRVRALFFFLGVRVVDAEHGAAPEHRQTDDVLHASRL